MNYYENEDETNKSLHSDSRIPIDRPHSVNRMLEPDIAMSSHLLDHDENRSDNDNDDNDDEPLNPFKVPSHLLKKILWAIFLPVNILFFLTVPDCRRKTFSRFPLYFITFAISTIYLGVLTYLLVWMVVIIGINLLEFLKFSLKIIFFFLLKLTQLTCQIL